MFDFGYSNHENEDDNNRSAPSQAGTPSSHPDEMDNVINDLPISLKDLLDKTTSIKKLLQQPRAGSIISSLRRKKNNKDVESWMTKTILPELLLVVQDDDVPVMTYIVFRLGLAHNHASALAEDLKKNVLDHGSDEWTLLSALTDGELSKRSDLSKFLRKIISYHPVLLNQIKSMFSGLF